MLFTENIKMAWESIRGARLRSLLTMFGIIVGIASVVTVVSLGEGLKRQISGQVEKLGGELRVIQPVRKQALLGGGIIPQAALPAGSITDKDIEAITKTEGVEKAVPVGIVSGRAEYQGRTNENFTIYASNHQLADILQQRVQFGGFYSANELTRNYAVIGRTVADQLFEERSPVGKTFKVAGQDTLVIGVFETKNFQPVPYSIDFNNAVVLPVDYAKKMNGGVTFYEVLAQLSKEYDSAKTVTKLKDNLKTLAGGNEKLGVYRPDEIIGTTNSVFYQVTLFVAGVALISLIVGGIGIMNIMFATVSERTREIGIRKAIGASNRQILHQFITEAILLSIIGCVLGVAVSLLINGLLRITTELQPILTV
nr:ABC transporter permease [bacterium]